MGNRAPRGLSKGLLSDGIWSPPAISLSQTNTATFLMFNWFGLSQRGKSRLRQFIRPDVESAEKSHSEKIVERDFLKFSCPMFTVSCQSLRPMKPELEIHARLLSEDWIPRHKEQWARYKASYFKQHLKRREFVWRLEQGPGSRDSWVLLPCSIVDLLRDLGQVS